MRKAQRGQSAYVSWVIVLGLAVVISFFLYSWSMEQARKSAESIELSSDPVICSEIGVKIDGICQSHRSLVFNATNTKNYEIAGFLLRNVGLYPEEPEYLSSKVVLIDIGTDRTERVEVLKQGTFSQAKIIPLAKKGRSYVHCESQAAVSEEIKQC